MASVVKYDSVVFRNSNYRKEVVKGNTFLLPQEGERGISEVMQRFVMIATSWHATCNI